MVARQTSARSERQTQTQHRAQRSKASSQSPQADLARPFEAADQKLSSLQFLALGRLASKQEGFRIFPVAANLERPEILEPRTFGCLRFRLTPELQLVQIRCRYLPLAKPVKQMIAERRRQTDPLYPGHLSPKRQARQLILNALSLTRIGLRT
jgi:hypothetical protein